MDVKGPGNGTDRLPVADEFPGHLLLVRAHFLWPAEGDAARLGGDPAVVRPADNEGALELRDACDMPTRHLSDEQRQRYANFAAAPSPDQLARYFHLDRSDREITDGLRGDHNRLGFALMLGSARCIGAFPGADVEIPGPVTAFLVDQLGLKKAPGLDGYFRVT